MDPELPETTVFVHDEFDAPGRDINHWSLVLDAGRREDAPVPTGRTLTPTVA